MVVLSCQTQPSKCISQEQLLAFLKIFYLEFSDGVTEGFKSALARLKQRAGGSSQTSSNERSPENRPISEKLSVGGGGKHRIAVLLHRSNPSPIHHRSAPGSPSPSVASYGSSSSSSDLLATASSALRRFHFKSSNVYRSGRGRPPVPCATSDHPFVDVKPSPAVVVAPATVASSSTVVTNSRSISTDSSATMNTSIDSANTATTMVTLTDNGEPDERIRITANLLEQALNQQSSSTSTSASASAATTATNNTTSSSTEKDEDFYSASSNDESAPLRSKSSENLNVLFPKEEILLEEYDDSMQPLLQYTAVPRPDSSPATAATVEDSKLPVIADGDPSLEWYNIKMRQQKCTDSAQKRALQTRRRLKLLSKRYSRCYFEEERVRNDKGRNSSGFAAEQMTIDSEDSFAWEDTASLASPPVPTSPTGSLTPTECERRPATVAGPSPSKAKQHFTFPPMTEANDLLNEFKLKADKNRRQSAAAVGSAAATFMEMATSMAGAAAVAGGGGELLSKKLRIESRSPAVAQRPRDEERTINKAARSGGCAEGSGGASGGGGVATIFVQQPSVTGNSPEQSYDNGKCELLVAGNNARRGSNVFGESLILDKKAISYCAALKQQQKDNTNSASGTSMKQMLDVTNTTSLHHWQDIDSKYVSSHHNRSQSVRTPGSKSNVQVGINGTSRYRPNYLCLPQQRTRVASMPNTGVEEEYYRLRQFSISGKGIINRGDSLKSRRSRSNTSVASSNSSHSTEQVTVCGTGNVLSGGGCSSVGGTISAVQSLPSSRESSCASCPGITPPFRVVMLGSSGVGKSSLVSQFMTSEYLQASGISIDEDFGEKSVCVSLDGEESEIMFIDQPSPKIASVDLSNYESPHGYCVVYSTSDRESFQQAKIYLQKLWSDNSISTKAVILVGNKTDLVRIRAVSFEEGTKLATSYECKFIETSVGINHNVDELLVGILTQIRLKLDNPPDPSIPRDQFNVKKRSRSPLGNCGPRVYRGSRTSASLRVRKILSKVWSINSKSKSCENLHVL